MTQGRGRVLLLNGPSSSGKSTVGVALQRLLPGPWFLVPVDSISGMRSTVKGEPSDEAAIADMLTRTRLGYHRAVAGLAAVGNDVIMDYPLSEAWRLEDLLDVLDGYDVTLIEVRCAPEELDRRERERGDRPAGLARSQTAVYDHGAFDITVDTTHESAEACAAAIVHALASVPSPKAFERLRHR
ncbi:chloramphenicol phosphotransferase CPT family protein [Nocardioides sp. LHG3406-4]|uniref:chloramphenicol phosphotransferase CPT family protein n=1 Tax=Nocardioides sp. LHG3406-4 TaxID=2804575 RepID=UPI003CE8E3F0